MHNIQKEKIIYRYFLKWKLVIIKNRLEAESSYRGLTFHHCFNLNLFFFHSYPYFLDKPQIQTFRICLFRFNNGNITMSEICSKLTIKTTEQHHWCRPCVFIVNFEQISNCSGTSSSSKVYTGRKLCRIILPSRLFYLIKIWVFLLVIIFCIKYCFTIYHKTDAIVGQRNSLSLNLNSKFNFNKVPICD